MGRNLFDFGDKDFEEKMAEQADRLDSEKKENLQQLHQKYKNYSEQDLFAELKKQQRQGNLDKNKMNQVLEKLGPFLSESQRQHLIGIVDKLDK